MGENFSLLHQYMYVDAWWSKLGFGGKAPMADSDYQAWLDARPRYTLTWYNQPTDTAHPYSAALLTVRDGNRVINLNLSQAPDYTSFTPYYPVPFSDKLIYGTTDLGYALLIPQVSYNGKTYIPVTYYKNLNVTESNGQGDRVIRHGEVQTSREERGVLDRPRFAGAYGAHIRPGHADAHRYAEFGNADRQCDGGNRLHFIRRLTRARPPTATAASVNYANNANSNDRPATAPPVSTVARCRTSIRRRAAPRTPCRRRRSASCTRTSRARRSRSRSTPAVPARSAGA